MSKERELLAMALIALEDAHLHIDKFQGEDARLSVIEQTKELLAQPEQKINEGIYDDIFDDLKYLIVGFENGADAADYSSEINRSLSDIRKARNWLCPLPKDVIDKIALESFYAGTFDFRVFARELEKQHGIGFRDE